MIPARPSQSRVASCGSGLRAGGDCRCSSYALSAVGQSRLKGESFDPTPYMWMPEDPSGSAPPRPSGTPLAYLSTRDPEAGQDLPAPSAASSQSRTCTLYPAMANACAICAPMVPKPMTHTTSLRSAGVADRQYLHLLLSPTLHYTSRRVGELLQLILMNDNSVTDRISIRERVS